MESVTIQSKGEICIEKSEINFHRGINTDIADIADIEENSKFDIENDIKIEKSKCNENSKFNIENKNPEENSEKTNSQDNNEAQVFMTIQDLNFKSENIIFIPSSGDEKEIHNLKQAFEEINKSDIIGLDSEWVKGKPPVKCITFQIATREKAYVFDFQPKIFHETLKEEIFTHNDFFNELFETLLSQVFKNEKILKVAWDFDLDLKNLNNRFQYNKKLIEMNNLIDLMREAPKFIEKGLSNHCLFYLGKKLDKTNQVCQWDQRPLTEDKIIYAALDAIVSVPLYEKMLVWQVKMTPGKLNIHLVNKRIMEWRKTQAAVHKAQKEKNTSIKFDWKMDQI